MRIYLAGGMKTHWREDFIEQFEKEVYGTYNGVEFLNPEIMSPQYLTSSTFVNKDLELVRSSDMLVLYMEKSNISGFGAVYEMAVAVENSIPVVVFWDKPTIHPFIACNSLVLTNSFESLVNKSVDLMFDLLYDN